MASPPPPPLLTTAAVSPPTPTFKQRQQHAMKRHLDRATTTTTPNSPPTPSSPSSTHVLEVFGATLSSSIRVHLNANASDMSVADMKRQVAEKLDVTSPFTLKAAGYELKDSWVGKEFGLDKSSSRVIRVELVINSATTTNKPFSPVHRNNKQSPADATTTDKHPPAANVTADTPDGERYARLMDRKVKLDRELLRAKEINDNLSKEHQSTIQTMKSEHDQQISQLESEIRALRLELDAIRLGAKMASDAFELEKKRLLDEIVLLRAKSNNSGGSRAMRLGSDEHMPVDEFVLSPVVGPIVPTKKNLRRVQVDGIATCFACPAWMLSSMEDEEDYFQDEEGSVRVDELNATINIHNHAFSFDAAVTNSVERLAVAIEALEAWDAVLEDKTCFSLIVLGEQCTGKRILLAGRVGSNGRRSSALGVSPRTTALGNSANGEGSTSPRTVGSLGLMELLMIRLCARVSSYSAESSGAFSYNMFCSVVHMMNATTPEFLDMLEDHNKKSSVSFQDGALVGATLREFKSVSDFSRIVSSCEQQHQDHASGSGGGSTPMAVIVMIEIKSNQHNEMVGRVQFVELDESFADIDSLRQHFGTINEKNQVGICVCLHPGAGHAVKSEAFANQALEWAAKLRV